ncbi:hypothetical protein J4573_18205 [Actinomadura barringtoniae]|uniref:Uncharacterized protein n=1 Tax=Actinomadura barringtoniae TaxID=1427535 RepID=A0A939PBB0_9ACTN|nr:hypothetical protein [Actinomadura barringtoniae]MBO2449042.1 hypothetical protein [Actinomadura barringtoniae]
MPNTPHPARNDLQEAKAKNRTARETLAAIAESIAPLSEQWERINATLTDTPALISEIRHLRAEIEALRLNLANLAAAARATLAAYRDAESDPCSYLRDELSAQGWADGDRP